MCGSAKAQLGWGLPHDPRRIRELLCYRKLYHMIGFTYAPLLAWHQPVQIQIRIRTTAIHHFSKARDSVFWRAPLVDRKTVCLVSIFMSGFHLSKNLCGQWIFIKNSHAIDSLIEEIEAAIDHGLFFSAVAVALTLPDVCSALELNQTDPNSVSNNVGQRYCKWFDTYLSSHFSILTAQDCYRLRCGILHQAKFGHHRTQYDRIIFTLPDSNNNIVHEFISKRSESILSLDSICFCRIMIRSVRRWVDTTRYNENVISNSDRLFRYRPNGLHPHIVGLPLIG